MIMAYWNNQVDLNDNMEQIITETRIQENCSLLAATNNKHFLRLD